MASISPRELYRERESRLACVILKYAEHFPVEVYKEFVKDFAEATKPVTPSEYDALLDLYWRRNHDAELELIHARVEIEHLKKLKEEKKAA